MRLVGTWDGKTPGVMAREPEVWAGLEAHGIAVLQTMPCDDRALGVTVAVADDDTVAWVTSHYQHIKIAGWLQPLPSGP
jgi:hypothetical protein